MIVDFLPFSAIDFPGLLSAVSFLSGCNLRCPFCHNPELVIGSDFEDKSEEFFYLLKERKNLLDGVVFTGGEPTLDKNLPELILKVKNLGFYVKLDTNGTNPDMLRFLIEKNIIDYIAMDVKCGLEKYRSFLGFKGDLDRILESIKIIKSVKNLKYEFRCTVGSFIEEKDIKEIARVVEGSKKFVIQRYIKKGKELLENDFKELTTYELIEKSKFLKNYVKNLEYRFYEN